MNDYLLIPAMAKFRKYLQNYIWGGQWSPCRILKLHQIKLPGKSSQRERGRDGNLLRIQESSGELVLTKWNTYLEQDWLCKITV